jgi:thioredoxin-related protein
MKNLLGLITLIFSLSSFSQSDTSSKGIQWTKLSSWDAVIAKAKMENKYVFVDCYTTWCAPCKKMDMETFSRKEVGEFINEKFIAVKIQMDSTKNDLEYVKNWHKDAARVMKQYLVSSFPTCLIFNPQGDLVEKVIGFQSENGFISITNASLKPGKKYDDPYKEFYSLKSKYESGIKEYQYFPYMIRSALDIGQAELAKEILQELHKHLLTLPNSELLNKNYIDFIVEYEYIKDKNADNNLVRLLIQEGKKVDVLMGRKNFSKMALNAMIRRGYVKEFYEQIVIPKLEKKVLVTDKEFDVLYRKIASLFNKKIAEMNILWTKFLYYREADKSTAVALLNKLVEKYGLEAIDISPMGIGFYVNDLVFAYGVMNSNSRKDNVLLAKLMKKYLESGMDLGCYFSYNCTDSYAQILYKIGKTKAAIKKEKEAIDLYLDCAEGKIGDETYREYANALTKMEKGEELIYK